MRKRRRFQTNDNTNTDKQNVVIPKTTKESQRHYSNEQVAKMRDLARSGLTTRETAQLMDIEYAPAKMSAAITGRLYKDVPTAPCQKQISWSPGDDQALAGLYRAQRSYKEIAEVFGCAVDAIDSRLRYLRSKQLIQMRRRVGNKNIPTKRISDSQVLDARIRHYTGGESVRSIARDMGLPYRALLSAVRCKTYRHVALIGPSCPDFRMYVPDPHETNKRLSPVQLREARRLRREEGMTLRQLASMFQISESHVRKLLSN